MKRCGLPARIGCMRSLLRILTILLMLLVPSLGLADSVAGLISRLERAEDFRVRVKAALELGKTRDSSVRAPLERALDDRSPAVRAAAAAALRVLGDERALVALAKHKNDKSESVRAQVRSTIAALKRKAERRDERPEVLVQFGEVSLGTSASDKLKPRFASESRRKLERLPGVMVLEDSEDPGAASRARQAPVVMVSARLQELEESRDGSTVVFSARVQYVVHTLPSKAIVGLVSGEASARATLQQSRDHEKVAQIYREVVAAAVEIAVRRAPAALKAAAQ
jgi:hypothetical protein